VTRKKGGIMKRQTKKLSSEKKKGGKKSKSKEFKNAKKKPPRETSLDIHSDAFPKLQKVSFSFLYNKIRKSSYERKKRGKEIKEKEG
jgi:hypothetical protein